MSRNRLDGAMAALKALKAMEHITENGQYDTLRQTLETNAAAIHAITDAAGPLPPFATGFLEAIAEHAHMCAWSGRPELKVWKPDAAMTADELAEYHRSLDSFLQECELVE